MEEEMYFTDIAQIKTINALLRVDTRRDRIEDLDLVVLYNTDSLNRQLFAAVFLLSLYIYNSPLQFSF